MKKTLYRRILKSFILIILLTVLLTTLIEFVTTRSKLPDLLTSLRIENIALVLSTAYTREKGWITVRDEIERIDLKEPYGRELNELIRIIVRDENGDTVYNSFTGLLDRSDSPLIEGMTLPVSDFDLGKEVGSVTLYMSKDYLDSKTLEYLMGIMRPRLVQGLIALLLALIIALFLVKHLTYPLRKLTAAADEIAREGGEKPIDLRSTDELEKLSESFNRMILALSNQRDLRKRLISDLSHEISTPLNVIRLEARGLKDHLTTSEKASGRIVEEVDKLSNLIHDLEWLAETDMGQFRLNKSYCSLGELIDEEAERWRTKAELEGLILDRVSIPENLPLLEIDRDRIGQVLSNLLENAIRYTAAPGTISLSCHRERNLIAVSVKDSGMGIDSGDLPYIFERFFRSDEAREITSAGRGLGLSIVRQIIELHGGDVQVRSERGAGSLFRFTLPLS